MAQMTADQLAADILARQGRITDLGGTQRRDASLTAKQTNWLFDLCDRAGYTYPVRTRGLRGADSGTWRLQERVGGSSLLSQFILAGDDIADATDALLDEYDALVADMADVMLDEYAWEAGARVGLQMEQERLATLTEEEQRANIDAALARYRVRLGTFTTPELYTEQRRLGILLDTVSTANWTEACDRVQEHLDLILEEMDGRRHDATDPSAWRRQGRRPVMVSRN